MDVLWRREVILQRRIVLGRRRILRMEGRQREVRCHAEDRRGPDRGHFQIFHGSERCAQRIAMIEKCPRLDRPQPRQPPKRRVVGGVGIDQFSRLRRPRRVRGTSDGADTHGRIARWIAAAPPAAVNRIMAIKFGMRQEKSSLIPGRFCGAAAFGGDVTTDAAEGGSPAMPVWVRGGAASGWSPWLMAGF